jgi:hypothetical protein
MSMDGGILRSLGFNAAMLNNSYSRLLHEVHATVVVIDIVIYNDPILVSSKPNARKPLC